MYLCSLGTLNIFNVDINNFTIISIFNIKTWTTSSFWLFVLSFGLKTLLGMIWNYLTRKFVLYKVPKGEISHA